MWDRGRGPGTLVGVLGKVRATDENGSENVVLGQWRGVSVRERKHFSTGTAGYGESIWLGAFPRRSGMHTRV